MARVFCKDLTAVIVCCGEANELYWCLQCLQWCGRRLVIDLKNEPATKQVGRKFKAEVINHRWVPYVERIYPEIPGLVETEWVLLVDPDERIPLGLAQRISKAIEQGNWDVISFATRHYALGGWPRYESGGYQKVHRVFRKGAVELRPLIHQGIVPLSPRVLYIPPANDQTFMYHLTNESISSMVQKFDRYTNGEAEKLIRHGQAYSAFLLLKRTIKEFVRHYIYRRGYRDGTRGFILSVLFAFYQFLAVAKLWEHQMHKDAQHCSYQAISMAIVNEYESYQEPVDTVEGKL